MNHLVLFMSTKAYTMFSVDWLQSLDISFTEACGVIFMLNFSFKYLLRRSILWKVLQLLLFQISPAVTDTVTIFSRNSTVLDWPLLAQTAFAQWVKAWRGSHLTAELCRFLCTSLPRGCRLPKVGLALCWSWAIVDGCALHFLDILYPKCYNSLAVPVIFHGTVFCSWFLFGICGNIFPLSVCL